MRRGSRLAVESAVLASLLAAGGSALVMTRPWLLLQVIDVSGLLRHKAAAPESRPREVDGGMADPVIRVPVLGQEAGTLAGTAQASIPPAGLELVQAPPPEALPPDASPEPPPRVPVNYAQLNRDITRMAEALERFNQKLLRLIAQAKTEQAPTEQASEQGPSQDSASPAEKGEGGGPGFF